MMIVINKYKYKYFKYIDKIHNLYGGNDIITPCNYKIIKTINIEDIKNVNTFSNADNVGTEKIKIKINKNEYEYRNIFILKKINIIFNNTTKEFAKNELINFGGQGAVFAYKSDDEIYIAIKFGYADDSLEGDIIIIDDLKMKTGKKICNECYIHSYASDFRHDFSSWSFIIMPYMTLNLKKFITDVKLDERLLIKIMIELFKMIKCLYSGKLYYTDIKPENILIKCNDSNTLNLVLGDLGGLSIYDRYNTAEYATITYPWLYREFEINFLSTKYDSALKISDMKIGDIIYPLAITFLMFNRDFDSRVFNYSTISNTKDNNITAKDIKIKTNERDIVVKRYYDEHIFVATASFFNIFKFEDTIEVIIRQILSVMLAFEDCTEEKLNKLSELFTELETLNNNSLKIKSEKPLNDGTFIES